MRYSMRCSAVVAVAGLVAVSMFAASPSEAAAPVAVVPSSAGVSQTDSPFVATTSTWGAVSYPAPAAAYTEIAEMINAERAARGLSQVEVDPGSSGQCSSDGYIATGVFHPQGCEWFGDTTNYQTTLGVMTTGIDTTGEAVAAFMGSSPHRTQILTEHLTKIRIGVTCVANPVFENMSIMTVAVETLTPNPPSWSTPPWPTLAEVLAWDDLVNLVRPATPVVTNPADGLGCGPAPETIGPLTLEPNVLTRRDPACRESRTVPFVDIERSTQLATDVQCIYGLGITTGTSPVTYSPNDPVTRAQMATFLARFWKTQNRTCPTTPSGFLDIPNGSYATAGINCIKALGITTGTSPTTFSPDDFVTRAQMATFLHRMLKLLGDTWVYVPRTPHLGASLRPFQDSDVAPAYSVNHIATLLDIRIITKDGGGYYYPNRPTTRAVMATYLANMQRYVFRYV